MTTPRGTARLDHPPETARRLRLWLRLLGTTTRIERELARRLRRRFGCSLARFDLMAQLEREPRGLTMSQLSERLMVTNGNVTGLVRRLVEDGLAVREADPGDRRLQRVRLTARGLERFHEMARAHAGWVDELLAPLDAEGHEALTALLDRLAGRARAAEDARHVA